MRHRQAKPVEHMGAASVDDGRCVAETNAPNIGKVARPYFPTHVFGVLSPVPRPSRGDRQVGVVTATAGVGYLNIYGRHKGTPPAPNPKFGRFARRVVSERAARIVKKLASLVSFERQLADDACEEAPAPGLYPCRLVLVAANKT